MLHALWEFLHIPFAVSVTFNGLFRPATFIPVPFNSRGFFFPIRRPVALSSTVFKHRLKTS